MHIPPELSDRCPVAQYHIKKYRKTCQKVGFRGLTPKRFMLFMGKHKTDNEKKELKQVYINIPLSIVDTETVFQSTESR
jgi:hypothetical protein